MFIDWLTVSQTHDRDLPRVSDTFFLAVDSITDEVLSVTQRSLKHESSYSTAIRIHVSGRTVRVDGNPSRIGRLDNLFGFTTIEQCIAVYNGILAQYGLPPFTRCTRVDIRQDVDGSKVSTVADGVVLQRIDWTTNVTVGKGNVEAYLRGISSQRIGHSIGFLYPNGRTVTWTPKGNGNGGRLQYRKAYDKAFELGQNLVPRIKRLFGEQSPEFQQVMRVHQYCHEQGVVRMEQELKSEYLKREGLAYWGLIDESRFRIIHDEFLSIDQRLKVTAMDLMSISDKLLEEGVVKSRQAANATAMWAQIWMSGSGFPGKKTQFETHAARLNRIGINIRNACDTSRFSPVFVREAREVNVCKVLPMPTWYERPNHLRAVA